MRLWCYRLRGNHDGSAVSPNLVSEPEWNIAGLWLYDTFLGIPLRPHPVFYRISGKLNIGGEWLKTRLLEIRHGIIPHRISSGVSIPNKLKYTLRTRIFIPYILAVKNTSLSSYTSLLWYLFRRQKTLPFQVLIRFDTFFNSKQHQASLVRFDKNSSFKEHFLLSFTPSVWEYLFVAHKTSLSSFINPFQQLFQQ